jgi:hypothetical protein
MPICTNALCSKEKKSLDGQRRSAWRKYYEQLEYQSQQIGILTHALHLAQYRNAQGQLERPPQLPTHITNELWEMAEQLNRQFTCPVCFDLTTKETIHMAWCGHLTCKECYARLPVVEGTKKSCPTCREKI